MQTQVQLPESSPDEHVAYLSDLGFAVDERFKCLICQGCKVGLVSANVALHMSNKHPDTGIVIDHKRLQKACKRLDVVAELPDMQGGNPIAAINGIKIHDGHRCGHCRTVMGQISTIVKHHRLHHPNHPMPSSWKAVKAQQWNLNEHKSYFEVVIEKPPHDIQSPQSIIDTLRNAHGVQETYEMTQEEENIDPRLFSPWLKSTGWHDLINGKDLQKLRDLVEPPKGDEFPGLADAVQHLFTGASELIDLLPELVLQTLNSPDPVKEYVKFRSH